MARKKIGAFSKKGGMDAVTTVAGALAGNVGANMLASTLMPTMDGTTKGLILLGGGIALNVAMKDPILKSVGLGIALNGGTTLLGPTGLAVISGTGRLGRVGRVGKIGRNGRYVTDGIARPKYSVRPGTPRPGMVQTGVIAGAPTYASDYSAVVDFDAQKDFR